MEKRGDYTTSSLEVLRKPLNTNVMIATHADGVRNYYTLLVFNQKFLRFPMTSYSITLLFQYVWHAHILAHSDTNITFFLITSK